MVRHIILCCFIMKATWKNFLQQIQITNRKVFSSNRINDRVNSKLKIVQEHAESKSEVPVVYVFISNNS